MKGEGFGGKMDARLIKLSRLRRRLSAEEASLRITAPIAKKDRGAEEIVPLGEAEFVEQLRKR